MGLNINLVYLWLCRVTSRSGQAAGTRAGAKERKEGGSTTRQDTVMDVVTVKTALVKEPLCAQVRIVQESQSWRDCWWAKYESAMAAQGILF